MSFPPFTNEQMYAIAIFVIVHLVITRIERMILESKVDDLQEQIKVLRDVVGELNKETLFKRL